MIHLIENRTIGTFDAVGPKAEMTMPKFVAKAQTAFDSEANFIHVDDYDFFGRK